MAATHIGWKFGADIKGPDGRLAPRTCYVAIADQEAASQALADEHPGLTLHPGPGQPVSSTEWHAAFEAEPADREVRCDG